MGLLNLLTYPPTARISTGLVAWYQERLVWALAQEKFWSSNESVSKNGSLLGRAVAARPNIIAVIAVILKGGCLC